MAYYLNGKRRKKAYYNGKRIWVETARVIAGETPDGAVAEITFTIDGTQYKALSGMTWGEWVESEYNTGGYYLHRTPGAATGYYIDNANSDDVIENGGAYTATYYVHGGGSND